jgi:hypothetical protein
MKLYEPLHVPKPVDRDLWIVDGPIVELRTAWGAVPFPTRTVVARLGDGGLWVWSPVALSEETRSALALGPVRHLVSPNKIHYAHVAAWKAAYPDAVAWASLPGGPRAGRLAPGRREVRSRSGGRVARECVRRVMGWDAEPILIAHGRWYEKDAPAELRRAFRWLDVDAGALCRRAAR